MIPRRLIQEIEDWSKNKRYGHLQVNFADGKIVNVNRVESFKVTYVVGEAPQSQTLGSTNDVQL